MAGSGAPMLTKLAGSGLKIAIVAASWHEGLMNALVAGAEQALMQAQVTDIELVRVPGTFELPVAASRLANMVDMSRIGNLTAGTNPFAAMTANTFTTEMPFHASPRMFDAIVALGVVIRGGTPHFEYVCEAATMGLTEVSVKTGVPIGFGVLTCDNEGQAWERVGNYPGRPAEVTASLEDKGYEASHAAVATALALRNLGS